MVFKTWLSDINKVALAMDELKGIQTAGTISKLNPKSLNAFVKGIDGLTLSQAQAALSTKALTDKQKEQILVSAGLLKTLESVTASEIKQTVTENILTAEKQQEILATFELDMSEGKLNLERLEAIALEDTEAGAIARVILAKKKENAENLKGIASGKSLLKVLKGQLATLATNPLTWAIGAFVGITAVALKSAEAIEKVREKASELGNEFSTSKSDIDGYKTQIEDLYKTINDSNSSVEDITIARQTLMTVQDELIDKFGKEKETIDLVTNAINGQSSALDTLKQKKWQETKNKFNESDFWTGVGNWSQGYKSNIDRMVDEMENPVVRIGMSINDFESGEYTEVIQQMEKLGWTYSNTLSAFTKDGGLEDLYEEILNIQNVVDENAPAHFLEELTTEANKAKATLGSYESMWDNYILNDKIFVDDNLADSWKEVNDAYTKYQNAVTSGDKTAIEEVTSGFATSINEVLNDENISDSVKDYFKDMYPALYREVEKWEFKTNIIPEFDTKGLNGKTQADILKMLQTEGMQEGEEEFNTLLLEAKEYGLINDTNAESINTLLNYLVQWQILQGEINDTASEYEIGEGFTSTIVSSVQQIATQLEPQFAKLGEAYKSIFTEDGFTLGNVDNPMLEDLRTTFSEIGEEIGVAFDSNHLEPFFDSLTNGTATVDQVQQAFNDVATAYFYSTDTLDKLNDTTAEAIQKQLQELGVINAKEVVYDTLATKTEALALEEQFLTTNGYSLAEATNMKAMMFLNEAGASETARQYLFQLVATEQIFNNQDLNAKQKIEELESLAIAYGQTAIAAKIANMEKAAEAGHTQIDYDKELKSLQAHLNDGMSQVKVDFKQIDTNASSAGRDAAEEYKEALEEELSNLGDVISYVGDIIGDQIDLWEDQKDAAVDSLNAQKEAAEDALEAQIDLVEEQIKAIENQIELKEKEIEKIQDARKERDLELASQKALAEWNQKLSQRTRLIYKEGNDGVPGQMVYEHDIKGIRDAKEEYDRTQEDLEINRIEKEIKILEDEISGLEDVIDGLNEQIEASNKYYDDLIKQTEKYYDSMIQGLEDYKSRWEELANIEKEAKMQVALKTLGIETTDILNMSEDAFNAFKNQYLNILTQMYNGETDMINAINSVAQGLDTTTLESGLTKTKENIDKLNNADFSSVKTGLENVSTGMDNVGSSATTASTGTTAMSDDLQKMNQNTEGLDTKLTGVSTALNSMPDSSKFEGIGEPFGELADAIERIASALGVSDGSVSGLITALQEISSVSLMGEDGEGGIISQFQSLKTAVDEVTSAINGGGGMNTEATAGTTASSTRGGEGEQGGGAGGLTGAIKEIGTTTDETMGAGSSEGGEGGAEGNESGGEGVLGKFSAFKDSVDAVTKAIGTGEEEEGSEEGASTLIGALQLHYEKAEETLPLVKSRFEELLESITACVEKLSELAGLMSSLDGISVGGVHGITPSLNEKGTDPHVSFGNMAGKAFAKGTGMFKGLAKDEPLAIVSEYGQPETIITPDGGAMITNEPTALSLKKGTVILNEEQTKDMLNNEPKLVYREIGKKKYVLGEDYDIVDGKPKFKKYITGDTFDNQRDYIDEMMSRFNFMREFESNQEAFTVPIHELNKNMETMTKQIENINNVNNTQSVSFGDIHVHCSGITSEEVAEQAVTEIQRSMFGLSNKALQKSSITR